MSTSTYTLTVLLNHLPCRYRAYSFESVVEIAEPHCYVGRLGVWCAILGEEWLWNMLEFWVPLLHLVFMSCTLITYTLLLWNGTWLKLTAMSPLHWWKHKPRVEDQTCKMAGHKNHPDPTEVDVHGHCSFLSPNDTPATSNRMFVHLHLYPKWRNKQINLTDEERCSWHYKQSKFFGIINKYRKDKQGSQSPLMYFSELLDPKRSIWRDCMLFWPNSMKFHGHQTFWEYCEKLWEVQWNGRDESRDLLVPYTCVSAKASCRTCETSDFGASCSPTTSKSNFLLELTNFVTSSTDIFTNTTHIKSM